MALNKTWPECRAWIEERAGKEQKVETVTGFLRNFLVEPFIPHPADTEYYVNINSVREVSKPIQAQLTVMLTKQFREIGSSSLTKAVSTLVMLTQRPRSS